MGKDVLDLGRAVETQIGEAGVDCLGDPHGVPGPVEEVRVGKGHVSCAHRHELGHVAHHDLFWHDTKAPVVHDRQRAVPTTVRAAVARLYGTREPLLVAQDEPRVAFQWRQEIACWGGEPTAAEVHHHVAGTAGRVGTAGPVRPCEQCRLVLPDDHPVGYAR